jgi:hypothetical protein
MGSWDGVDHKGLDREVVVMEWRDVPEGVRGWIAEQQQEGDESTGNNGRRENEKSWWFGVFEKPRTEGEKVSGTVRVGAPSVSTSRMSEQGGGGEGHEEKKKVEVGGEKREVKGEDDKIVVFPAGAAYEILPLWVAKGSGCERKHASSFCITLS